jgi:acetyl-CoA carboxylase / biotin carboxylase 1
MGIPLDRIPDVRVFYNEKPYEKTKINFDKAKRRDPLGHVIAVRITAENTNKGFQPTSGTVSELNFRDSPNVWGYFSIRSNSGIHNFSDSQFGHIFAFGKNREEARITMISTLSEVSIRGDIKNTANYVRSLIKKKEFIENNYSTSYLDSLIKDNYQIEKPDTFVAIISGALHTVHSQWKSNLNKWTWFVSRGQIPSDELLRINFEFELIYEGKINQ